jgi:hypothetical protein
MMNMSEMQLKDNKNRVPMALVHHNMNQHKHNIFSSASSPSSSSSSSSSLYQSSKRPRRHRGHQKDVESIEEVEGTRLIRQKINKICNHSSNNTSCCSLLDMRHVALSLIAGVTATSFATKSPILPLEFVERLATTTNSNLES